MAFLQRFPLKLFFRDKIILLSTILSVMANLGLWIYLPLALTHKDRLIFLHYTVHLGVDYVGNWTDVFNLPLIAVIFLIVNLVVAYFIYSHKFFSRLLLICSLIIQIIFWVDALFLVFLNF